MVTVERPAGIVDDHAHECDVVVICVTYNSAAVIEPMIAALPDALNGVNSCRVVFVDNASSDATPAMIRELAPWSTLLQVGYNAGYAGGINIALQQVSARRGAYIVNPDAVSAPGSIALLLDAVERDQSTGIAVPRIVDHHGRLKFSLRRRPTIARAVGEALLGGHRAGKFVHFGDMIRNPRYYRDGATADWATGAAIFISRSTLDAVGAWDERFFLYSEETDYALRAQDAGYQLRLVYDAVVRHPGGEMEASPFLWSLVAVNRTRLYRKRHGLACSAVFWIVVVLNEGTRGLLGRKTNLAAFRALLSLGPNPSGREKTPALIQAGGRASVERA